VHSSPRRRPPHQPRSTLTFVLDACIIVALAACLLLAYGCSSASRTTINPGSAELTRTEITVSRPAPEPKREPVHWLVTITPGDTP
jgi:hypothetical protein